MSELTSQRKRSQFCMSAIYEKLNPPAPAGEINTLLARLQTLEQAVVTLLEQAERPPQAHKPTDLDQAIADALIRIRPTERK